MLRSTNGRPTRGSTGTAAARSTAVSPSACGPGSRRRKASMRRSLKTARVQALLRVRQRAHRLAAERVEVGGEREEGLGGGQRVAAALCGRWTGRPELARQRAERRARAARSPSRSAATAARARRCRRRGRAAGRRAAAAARRGSRAPPTPRGRPAPARQRVQQRIGGLGERRAPRPGRPPAARGPAPCRRRAALGPREALARAGRARSARRRPGTALHATTSSRRGSRPVVSGPPRRSAPRATASARGRPARRGRRPPRAGRPHRTPRRSSAPIRRCTAATARNASFSEPRVSGLSARGIEEVVGLARPPAAARPGGPAAGRRSASKASSSMPRVVGRRACPRRPPRAAARASRRS